MVLRRQVTRGGQPATAAACMWDGRTWGERSPERGDHSKPGDPKGTGFGGRKERSAGEPSDA